jgi:hypothetical protein
MSNILWPVYCIFQVFYDWCYSIVYFRCSMTSVFYISGVLWLVYCIFQVFYDWCIVYFRCSMTDVLYMYISGVLWQVYCIFQVFYEQCIVYFRCSISSVLCISGVLWAVYGIFQVFYDRCIVYCRCCMTGVLYISSVLWQVYCMFQVFDTEEETQIPALRSHIHQMTSLRHKKSLDGILLRVAQFIFKIEKNLNEDRTVQVSRYRLLANISLFKSINRGYWTSAYGIYEIYEMSVRPI